MIMMFYSMYSHMLREYFACLHHARMMSRKTSRARLSFSAHKEKCSLDGTLDDFHRFSFF